MIADIKSKIKQLKKRVEQRRKNMPANKTDEDAAIENQNAAELRDYVYKLVAEGDK